MLLTAHPDSGASARQPVNLQLVEALYRERWTQLDGLGALVLSPTRELALQIFADLRKVGKHHSLSAGLLIGGKNVSEERQHILSTLQKPLSSLCRSMSCLSVLPRTPVMCTRLQPRCADGWSRNTHADTLMDASQT